MRRNRHLNYRVLWLAVSSVVWSPAGGRAQDRFAAESFDPAPAVEGSVLAVHGAHTLAPRTFTLSAFTSYGREILTIESEQSGETLGVLIGSMGTLNLMGAVGLWKRLDIGVALPLHRIAKGSDYTAPPPGIENALMRSTEYAVGDLRLVPRLNLLDPKAAVGLALLLPLYLPTGKDEHYAGEAFRIEPRMSVDFRSEGGLLLAANVGYLVRERTHILESAFDDMLRVGVGTDVPLGAGLSLLAEIDAQFNVLADGIDKSNAPTEGLAGLRFRKSGWLAQLGGGPGIVRGMTAPRYRLFASVSFTRVPPPDSDGDQLTDDVDQCPQQPEDRDRFEDTDGCPDPDDDHDGVADAQDRCPKDLEDTDGFHDDDGCPEADNDGDGIADAQDVCADEPEDKDGFSDADGCPDLDNDDDGVADAEDQCRDQPGTLAHQGCPPPPAPERVAVTEQSIELSESIYFAKNRADIEARSEPLLDEIAKVLKDHPEITRVVVEGHTDATGSPRRNRTLSKQRAEAVVRALIKRGVIKERLRSEGFGPDRPIDSNDTEEGREKNRRVALTIAERVP
jgi:outer membrane protein OmpA-like peptidoglycan-associated protein